MTVQKAFRNAVVESIIESLAPLIDKAPKSSPANFAFHASKELGGPHLLDGLWHKLGMAEVIHSLVKERQFQNPLERLIFAMVAGRILEPGSKLSLEHWIAKKAYMNDLKQVDVHNLSRMMDVLIESDEKLQKEVFSAISRNTKLDVDLIFLDTTNIYFETEEDASDSGLLKRGRSKDGRSELPLVSIAFAVAKKGIPLRCWVFPGNTSDQTIVEEVKRDLGEWNLGHVIMVEDAGFNSADNRIVRSSMLQSS